MAQLLSLSFVSFFSGAEILYDEHRISCAAARLMPFAGKIGLCRNFHKAGLSMNLKEGEGFALSQRAQMRADTCLEKFCMQYLPEEPASFRKMVKSYLARFLLHRFMFMTMVEAKVKCQENTAKDIRHVLYVQRHPLNSVIFLFDEKKDFDVKECGVMETAGFFTKPALCFLAILAARFIPAKARGNIDRPRPAVWVEYANVGMVDFLFWRGHVKAEAFDVVYYLDRNDDGLRLKFAEMAGKRGCKWIDLHFFPMISLSGIRLSELNRLFPRRRRFTKKSPRWLRLFYFDYELYLLLYEKIFRRFQVKVLIQHQEAFWRQEVQAKAVEAAGGIMLGYNWSNYYFLSLPTHIFPHHVYFTWGEEIREYMEKIGNAPRNILPSGLWMMRPEGGLDPKPAFSDGLDFVIAIFDNSAGYNIQYSTATLARFYLEILGLIEDNPRWGAIVKSKNSDRARLRSLPEGEKIVSRMDALAKEKRFVMLDRQNNPLAASGQADLSVCFGLNSAGIISAVHGCRAIHWDCGGIRHRTFQTDAGQKIVYLSLDDLKAAIVKAAGGDRTIGDFTEWRQKFNYFDDLLAPERIGGFIQTFMCELARTNDAKHSLDISVKKYREENGLAESKKEVSYAHRSL